MRKVTLLAFAFMFMVQAGAQSIVGHWIVTDITGSAGLGFDLSDKGLEKMFRDQLKSQEVVNSLTEKKFKLVAESSKTPLTAADSLQVKKDVLEIVNNPDSAFLRDQVKEMRKALKETFAGIYMQFNPDGTYGLGGFKEEEAATGDYKVDKKLKRITLTGDQTEKYFYDFRGETLHLVPASGEGELFLKKRK